LFPATTDAKTQLIVVVNETGAAEKKHSSSCLSRLGRSVAFRADAKQSQVGRKSQPRVSQLADVNNRPTENIRRFDGVHLCYLFKHQRQSAQATYMPVKSSTMNICMLNNDTK